MDAWMPPEARRWRANRAPIKPEARTRAGLRVGGRSECVESCRFWHGVFDAPGGVNSSSEEDLFTDAVGQRGRQYQRSRAPVRVLQDGRGCLVEDRNVPGEAGGAVEDPNTAAPVAIGSITGRRRVPCRVCVQPRCSGPERRPPISQVPATPNVRA
jgi:hypothetical protein